MGNYVIIYIKATQEEEEQQGTTNKAKQSAQYRCCVLRSERANVRRKSEEDCFFAFFRSWCCSHTQNLEKPCRKIFAVLPCCCCFAVLLCVKKLPAVVCCVPFSCPAFD
jgi:hypothetical protein